MFSKVVYDSHNTINKQTIINAIPTEYDEVFISSSPVCFSYFVVLTIVMPYR
jgi:hypothetical protein